MERRGGDDTKHAGASAGAAGAVGEKVYGSSTKKRASAGFADGADEGVEAGAAGSTGGNEVRNDDDAGDAGGKHGAGRRIFKKGAAGPSAAGRADAYGRADTRASERDGREHALCDDSARPGIHSRSITTGVSGLQSKDGSDARTMAGRKD